LQVPTSLIALHCTHAQVTIQVLPEYSYAK
jgi:hypothetical protein